MLRRGAGFLGIVTDGAEEAQVKAAGALRNLALHETHRRAIIQAGAIGPLVALLRTGTAEGQARAAVTLWSLAVDAENQVSCHPCPSQVMIIDQ